MATANIPNAELEKHQHEWLTGLTALVEAVEKWAQELGWSTRRIETRMEDSEVGTYRAPALLMQAETTRLFLEPIARSAPNEEGRVDLYVMPAYDDIASLFFSHGKWELLYVPVGTAVATSSRVETQPLSKAALQEVLQTLRNNAA